MKRILAILTICVFVTATATLPLAAAGPVATAWKTVTPITIDGDLAEWNKSAPIVLDSAEQVIRDLETWAGPDDCSGQFYIMWDETNLYIGAEITEDTPFGATPMLPIADNDNVTLYISTDPTADPGRTSYQSNDFRVILVTDDNYWDNAIDRSMVADQKGFWSIGVDGGESVIKGYQRAGQLTTTGIVFEAALPWATFSNAKIPLFVPTPGVSIGFNIVLTDIAYPCPGTEYIPAIAWTGDDSVASNPSVWGTLVFKLGTEQ